MKYLKRSNKTCTFKVHYRCQLLHNSYAKFSPTFTITVPNKQKFMATENTKRKQGAVHTKMALFLKNEHASSEFTVLTYNERTIIYSADIQWSVSTPLVSCNSAAELYLRILPKCHRQNHWSETFPTYVDVIY